MLELILVMFILAMVFGGGLGLFAALDLGRRQSVGLVKNALRSAQNTAAATQAPARVRIDAGTLRAETLAVIGTWHFEERKLAGAFGIDGVADPERFVTDGYIGDALSFAGALGTDARIPVKHLPSFDLTHGFAVRCAVRLEDTGGGVLLSIGNSVRIDVGGAGDLRGSFLAAKGDPRNPGTAGNVVVQSEPGVLAPERWTLVRLHYDRHELVLEVDGVPVAITLDEAPVFPVDGPIQLSDGRRPLPGSIDNLIIEAVAVDEPVVLPETVRISSAPPAVHFDAGGGLDRLRHAEPVQIELSFEDGERTTIGVGFYGTVEG